MTLKGESYLSTARTLMAMTTRLVERSWSRNMLMMQTKLGPRNTTSGTRTKKTTYLRRRPSTPFFIPLAQMTFVLRLRSPGLHFSRQTTGSLLFFRRSLPVIFVRFSQPGSIRQRCRASTSRPSPALDSTPSHSQLPPANYESTYLTMQPRAIPSLEPSRNNPRVRLNRSARRISQFSTAMS